LSRGTQLHSLGWQQPIQVKVNNFTYVYMYMHEPHQKYVINSCLVDSTKYSLSNAQTRLKPNDYLHMHVYIQLCLNQHHLKYTEDVIQCLELTC
jgi:hypothetical protein